MYYRRYRRHGPPVSRWPDPHLEDLKPEDVGRQLDPSALDETSEIPGSGKADARKDSGESRERRKGTQILDLMVIVHPRELDKAAMRSLLADAIASPAATPSSAEAGKANEQLAAALEAARKKHPDDLSVAIAELALGAELG